MRQDHALTNNTEQEVAGYPINVYAGGASLISPRFLLTAAHIFNTDGQYAIRSVLCRFLFGSLQCVYYHYLLFQMWRLGHNEHQ